MYFFEVKLWGQIWHAFIKFPIIPKSEPNRLKQSKDTAIWRKRWKWPHLTSKMTLRSIFEVKLEKCFQCSIIPQIFSEIGWASQKIRQYVENNENDLIWPQNDLEVKFRSQFRKVLLMFYNPPKFERNRLSQSKDTAICRKQWKWPHLTSKMTSRSNFEVTTEKCLNKCIIPQSFRKIGWTGLEKWQSH